MTYQFLKRPLEQGRYEPEGIYLSLPVVGEAILVQSWGEHEQIYRAYRYNGVPLKGHNGLDFQISHETNIIAVDDGRVQEIGRETNGFDQYIKMEHVWGESFYANLSQIVVDSGQQIKRAEILATIAPLPQRKRNQLDAFPSTYLHFGIRVRPYNRFDGWGGFTNPLPYLDPSSLTFGQNERDNRERTIYEPHSMFIETENRRRP